MFDGVDLLKASPEHMRGLRGSDISMVFQDAQAALNPVQLVGTQLEEVILAHTDVSTRVANGMAQDMLREVGLPDPRRIMGQYPFSLSGGMCQRVMIGIALVLKPITPEVVEIVEKADVPFKRLVKYFARRPHRPGGPL